jgi:hypothetical protein
MIKRLLLALTLAGLLSPAFGAGTILYSLSQQLDSFGKPLAGCKFYTYVAGTVASPQNAYQDSALTIALPNPQTCDSAGRLPQMFLADGQIKVRLTDRNLLTQVVADNIQVIGNSSGGGGGGAVDPTTILSTGDIKTAYGTSPLTGFVRANGRTIGSATSGATERANADTQALFVYLWGVDGSLAVSGGRGATAAADFAANKTIAIPDFRGRVLASFDDMGNTAAGRLTGTTMTGVGIGAVSFGVDTRTIITSWLPAYTPAGTYSTSLTSGTLVGGTLNSGTLNGGSASVDSGSSVLKDGIGAQSLGGSGIGYGWSNLPTVGSLHSTGTVTGTVSGTVSGTVTGTVSGSITGTAQGGSSTPFSIVQPTIFVTTYLKL